MSRFDYVQYDAAAMAISAEAKEKCIAVEILINGLAKGRAQALALTKLEEVYMWMGKAIRDEQIERNGSAELLEQRKNG